MSREARFHSATSRTNEGLSAGHLHALGVDQENADPEVITFLWQHEELWRSPIVLYELELGVQCFPPGRRRDAFRRALAGFREKCQDCFPPIESRAAEPAARLRAQAQQSGRGLDLGITLLAAMAKTYTLSVVTSRTEDFAGLDVDVTNPWGEPWPSSWQGAGRDEGTHE